METKDKNYFFLIAIHVLVGLIISFLPSFATFYFILTVILSFYFVIKTQNKNNEVLYVSGYIVGSEVFFRMTNSSPSYEFGKYGVIFFSILGMYYNGVSKKATFIWIYLLLLLPGLILGAIDINLNSEARKILVFNISGPICLGFIALYCYNRKFTLDELSNLLLLVGLPIVTCVTYLFFKTPNIKELLVGTGSNNALSGGFGANQVATILGLGMFIFVVRLIFNSKTKLMFIINLILSFYLAYRGFLTFSRGGMVTGIIMIIVFLGYIYLISTNRLKAKLYYFIAFLVIIMGFVWTYTSIKTDGLIEKRYANQDKRGRSKEDLTTGRSDLAALELELFYDNIIFGIGVGKGNEFRKEKFGIDIASHDEITRTLSEHGIFGILILIILIFTPIIFFFRNLNHIYLISFYLFWFFTINHAAMRTVSPAFFYGLTLLNIRKNKENE